MKLFKIQELLSAPRFERYLIASGSDEKKALKLYRLNLRLASGIHPLLGVLEVVLRNRLDFEIAKHFNEPNWSIKKRHLLSFLMQKTLKEAEHNLVRKGGSVTHAKLISDQNLGFWTEMFEKSNFGKVGGCPIKAFSFLPKQVKREELRLRLKRIRLFRNRINHNEPICFMKGKIDFSEANEVYRSILETLEWIDPIAPTILKGLDAVPVTLRRAAVF